MTQDQTTIETQYRIHWRSSITGATGHSTGLYTKAEVDVWIAALNRDESNIKLGLTHWAEPVESR